MDGLADLADTACHPTKRQQTFECGSTVKISVKKHEKQRKRHKNPSTNLRIFQNTVGV